MSGGWPDYDLGASCDVFWRPSASDGGAEAGEVAAPERHTAEGDQKPRRPTGWARNATSALPAELAYAFFRVGSILRRAYGAFEAHRNPGHHSDRLLGCITIG